MKIFLIDNIMTFKDPPLFGRQTFASKFSNTHSKHSESICSMTSKVGVKFIE